MSLRHLFGRRFVSLPLLILYKVRVVTLQSLANCPKTHAKTSPYLGQSLRVDTNPSAILSQSLTNPSPILQFNASKSTPAPPEIRANPSPAPHSTLQKPKMERRPARHSVGKLRHRAST